MSAAQLTKAAPTEFEAREKRLAALIAAIHKADTDEDREDAVWYARHLLERLVSSGYSQVAAEGQALRIRKASGEVAQRLAPADAAPGAVNALGFNVPLFKVRLQRLQAVISQYSPAEFARECARLARTADPRVLAEDEFQ